MKKQTRFLCAILCALCAIVSTAPRAEAKINFEMLKDIQLEDTPKDITLSRDGSTVYILGTKSIMVYSVPEAKVTDSIPLTKAYSRIALSPDESTFYLTAQDEPQIAVIQYALINTIEVGKSPVIGNVKAPVTVTAFLDYQCPYFAKVYPLLQELLQKYPKDVRLVIKQYPLPMHKFAEKASLAALAAAQQNKFEKVTELFFTNFTTLNDETIRKYVQDAGADMKKFDIDVAGAAVKDILQQDQQAVKQARVRSVPTIYINGIVPKGRSIENFSQMVEGELKNKK
ncbi:MAG: thioredoxin domain-containing protein [Proteobacteria bacterium]|nr:thioredoxin domain-containing protein [Pseudomonadota bacterium]